MEQTQHVVRRRSADIYAHSGFATALDMRPDATETWRDLCAAGVTFALGLAAAAALVFVLP